MAIALALCVVPLPAAPRKAPERVTLKYDREAQRNWIVVKGTIGGKHATLVLDTGAELTIIDKHAGKVTDKELKEAVMNGGSKLSAIWTGVHKRIEDLCLEEHCFERPLVNVVDLGPMSIVAGQHVDGILGEDLLRKFDRVAIDFKKATVTLSIGEGQCESSQ